MQKHFNGSDSQSPIFKYPICLWSQCFAKNVRELILSLCFKVGRMILQVEGSSLIKFMDGFSVICNGERASLVPLCWLLSCVLLEVKVRYLDNYWWGGLISDFSSIFPTRKFREFLHKLETSPKRSFIHLALSTSSIWSQSTLTLLKYKDFSKILEVKCDLSLETLHRVPKSQFQSQSDIMTPETQFSCKNLCLSFILNFMRN